MTRFVSVRNLITRLPEKLVRLGINRPKATVWFWLFLSFLMCGAITRLDLDTSTSAFLDQSSPAWQVYQHSLQDYGGDEFIVVAIEGREPFDRETLESVRELTLSIQHVPGVRRVDSLSTVPLIRNGSDGELLLTPALKDGVPKSKEELNKLVADLRRDRIAPNSLYAENGHVFALNVMLNDDVSGDRTQIVTDVLDLIAGKSARASGVPLFRTAVNSRTYVEVLIFVPLTLLCVALIVTLAFANIRPVIAPLAVGATGSLTVVGVMSLAGVPLSLSTMILPSILLALACAYSMHLLTAAQGLSDPRSLGENLERVAKPIALSGLTTAIGFIAMATVRIAAIEQMAFLGAFGVATVTISTLNLGPAVLRLCPIPNKLSLFGRVVHTWLLPRVLLSADHYRIRSLAVWFALLASLLVGVFALRVSTDIIMWFPKGTEIRDDYEAVRTKLSGISPVNLVLSAHGDHTVTDPECLLAIDALTVWLNEQPEIGKTLAVTDPLRQLHSALTYSDDAGLPTTKEMAEQYLLLLESVEYIEDVVTDDRTGANILLRVNDNGSDRLVDLGRRIQHWWVDNGPDGYAVETTGLMYEFGRSEERIAHGQATGLAIALLSIGLVLLVILKVPRNAAVALIPNAVPLVIAFGLMGFARIPLDAATVCLGSLALGIAVDDTIHIMTNYSDRRRLGEAPTVALNRSMENVIPALVFTTAAIVSGFAVLAFSQFTLIRNLGLVTSGLVFLCLLADLTLLPPLILTAERKSK